ncbi:hypothetical protein EPO33_01735 [Patescibacteria group bacterium]|nr:MAG: hypothetical protein EPO33_01735 [Patescibacteria group bacterium]
MNDDHQKFRVFRVLPGLVEMTQGGAGERRVCALFPNDTVAEYLEGPMGPEQGAVRVFEKDELIHYMKMPGEVVKKAIEDQPKVFRIVTSRIRTDKREGRGREWIIERIVQPDCGLVFGLLEDAGDAEIICPPWAVEELTGDSRYTLVALLRRYRELFEHLRDS